MGNQSGRWEISEDCDWEDAVVRENAGRRFEVGRRGVGRGVANLGVRASHEIARVIHEIGPYLYEEVSDQRAGSLHPPLLAAAYKVLFKWCFQDAGALIVARFLGDLGLGALLSGWAVELVLVAVGLEQVPTITRTPPSDRTGYTLARRILRG